VADRTSLVGPAIGVGRQVKRNDMGIFDKVGDLTDKIPGGE
jgi:hypothetical protein